MKEYTIYDIEALTETNAAALALEKLDVKGHTVYLVDFQGYFGYSCLVFKNRHHLRHANDYELHHKGKTHDQLRRLYLDKLTNTLFTPEEIIAPLSDYMDYVHRFRYLQNIYGLQEDHISIFSAGGTKQEMEERKKKVAKMIYCPIGLAYYDNSDFVSGYMTLYRKLKAAQKNVGDDFEYWKSAFKYEMANHEYAINWQADFDTLSAFGNIQYHGEDDGEVTKYFDELNFSEAQRKAYWAAKSEYLRTADY